MSGATSARRPVVQATDRGSAPDGDRGPAERFGDSTQELLPPYRWLLQPDQDRFAHPAEVELARLLTFYGVRWSYEPTTFALRGDDDGPGREFVTPDFYLPDHDLYLELTTMRQRLVTRKNRKFRKLRERYPNIRVRILYQRDFQRLQEAVAPLVPGRAGRLGPLLYAEEEIAQRVTELAGQLIASWQVGPAACRERPLLLGVGAGSLRFLGTLAGQIRDQGVAVDIDRADLSPVANLHRDPRARVSRSTGFAVAGRPVTIVQEVLSTGLSAAFLERWLRRQGAGSVGVCALLDREVARILDVPGVCSGFAAPDVPLAGFGLARWQGFRDLPFVASVEPE